jgi:hypothetical protein
LPLIQSTVLWHQETCFIISVRISCVRQSKLNAPKI